MSRTYRNELTPEAVSNRYLVKRLPHESLVRDGRKSIFTVVRRDNRCTGFREHRRYRARTRFELKRGDDDEVVSGKKRRYGDRYGDYEL